MKLADVWNQIEGANEADFSFPDKPSDSERNPWHSNPSELAKIGMFLRLFQPSVVVELGTFEARGTEFILEEMKKYAGGKITILFTVDVPYIPMWLPNGYGETTAPGFDASVTLRRARIKDLVIRSGPVELIYIERLAYDAGPIIVKVVPEVNFIFHDACHLAAAMMDDIKSFGELKEGTVICFDNVLEGHCIFDFLGNEFKDWDSFHLKTETGQLWLQRR